MQLPFAQFGMNFGFSALSIYGLFEKTFACELSMILDYEIIHIWLTFVRRQTVKK